MVRELSLSNRFLRLALDDRGRVASLRTSAGELISCPQHGEAWRLIVPTGRHPVDFA